MGKLFLINLLIKLIDVIILLEKINLNKWELESISHLSQFMIGEASIKKNSYVELEDKIL
jgi:hypothetical protein